MQRDAARHPIRLLRVLYWPAKMGQLCLLLLSLSAFAYGAYENVAGVCFLLWADPIVGRVSNIESLGDDRGGGMGGPLHFPIIEYHWPPTSPDSRWVLSVVPRDDLRLGDRIQVRVLPGMPDLARQRMPIWWQPATLLLLLTGFLATRYLMGGWYALDAVFGRRSPGQAGSGDEIFRGPAVWRLVIVLGLPAMLIAGLYLYYVPFLMPNQLDYFWDRPGRLLHAAGARGGPPSNGPLNRHERRLLSIPGLGRAASRDGFERALRLADMRALDRYLAAIADPGIVFEVDMTRIPALLMARQTAILERFLDTGVEIPRAARRRMVQIAERQRMAAKMRVLEAHGITREAMVR